MLGAGNYSYIEEWTFRDDGTILARAGSTGPKLGHLAIQAATCITSPGGSMLISMGLVAIRPY